MKMVKEQNIYPTINWPRTVSTSKNSCTQNIVIIKNNTDDKRLLNAIHTRYTLYLLLENAVHLVKMTRTLNRPSVTAYYRSVLQQVRETISGTLVSICLIEGDPLIQV